MVCYFILQELHRLKNLIIYVSVKTLDREKIFFLMMNMIFFLHHMSSQTSWSPRPLPGCG